MANLFRHQIIIAACWCLILLAVTGCKRSSQQPSSSNPEVSKQRVVKVSETPKEIDPTLFGRINSEHWTGDLDGIRQRRYIRTLVLYNKTNFFYDGPQARGITYEALKEFEKFLNAKLNTGQEPIYLVFIPVSREEGTKRMRDGRGDLAASNIPIIPELQQLVDFSDPVRERAKEVIVTGPSAAPIASLDDLSGKEVFVRKVSRYWLNLERLNERFRAARKPAVILKEADPNLEDEDILDM